MAAVDLRAVSKTYDGRQFAVREVSLSVQDGELARGVGLSPLAGDAQRPHGLLTGHQVLHQGQTRRIRQHLEALSHQL